MTVAASVIVSRARTQLVDAGATRWPDAELLKWLSDGQRALVVAVPAASAKRSTIALAAGTLQTIPGDGHMLLTAERNNGAADGSAPGRALRVVSRELVEAFDPDWHTATAKAVAQNYVFDPNTPKSFFVTPPNDGTGHADIVYSVNPPELASTADAISVADIYQTALVDYVLYRAFEKDADFNAGASRAQAHMAAWQAAIGQTEGGIAAGNPNLGLTPPDMSSRGAAK